MDHRPVVIRGDLYRRMQSRGRRATHHDRDRKSRLTHRPGHVRHLLERRRDQAGETDKVRTLLDSPAHDLVGRHHHAQVDHLIIITSENNRDNVLANVVHVALHRSEEYLARLGRTCRLFLRLNGRAQDGNRLLHRAGRLHHLRQEHLSSPEQLTHPVHTGHQRPVDNRYRPRINRKRLLKILLQMIANTFH